MPMEDVQVPSPLLLTRDLAASVKLTWMVWRLDAHLPEKVHFSPARLSKLSGLTTSTTRKAVTKLIQKGLNPEAWHEQPAGTPTIIASVPVPLVLDHTLGPQARVTYGLLQVTPDYRRLKGRFRYPSLGDLASLDSKTLRRAVGELAQAGWLEVSQTNRQAPIHFRLCNPVTAKQQREVVAVQRRLEKAPYLGEALMREYLTLIVDSDDFQDDAAPGFLVNPITSERMELDRFYPHHTAFEFNGTQHYLPTPFYPAEIVAKQKARDLMKMGICAAKEIRLVIVHPEDLTLTTMQQKVGDLLPHRDLRGHDMVIRVLEAKSNSYRKAARRGWKEG